MYKLFIDDLRIPPASDFIIARSSEDAVRVVLSRGMPSFISFDHDLGGEDTAILFINKVIELVLDGVLAFPDDFSYHIHSANPVGLENIKSKMDCAIKHLS